MSNKFLPNPSDASKSLAIDDTFLFGYHVRMKAKRAPDFLNPKYAAKLIGVTPQRVWQLVRENLLIHKLRRGRIVVSRASVMEYKTSLRGINQFIDRLRTQSKLKKPLKVKEAAELLGMSRQCVHVRLKAGEIKGERVGKYWFVEKESCEAARKNKSM